MFNESDLYYRSKMTYILNNISSWLTESESSSSLGTNTDDVDSDWVGSEMQQTTAYNKAEAEYDRCIDCSETESSQMADADDNTLSKVVHSAIEWGGFLLNYGKETSKNVTSKAFSHLKSALEENSSSESSATELVSEEPVAPWIGYPNESAVKSQIVALSQDKRNFLRGPPAGVKYHFDYTISYPVAMVMLDEDPKLQTMRFELVPKQLKEETFWRNYFYHVALIKQSAQLMSRDKVKAEASNDDSDADHKVPALLTTSELDIEFVKDEFSPGGSARSLVSKANVNSGINVDWEPVTTQTDDLEDFEMVEVNDCVMKTVVTECT